MKTRWGVEFRYFYIDAAGQRASENMMVVDSILTLGNELFLIPCFDRKVSGMFRIRVKSGKQSVLTVDSLGLLCYTRD